MNPIPFVHRACRSLGGFLAGAVLLGVAQAAPEKIINVQFGVDGGPRRSGGAAVGFDAGDYWNFYSRDLPGGGYSTLGKIRNLRWSDSSDSSADLVIENAPGAWGNQNPDPMFGAYLYPFDGGNILVTITNLPAGTYSVYPFGHGGPVDEQNTRFEVFTGSISRGVKATSSKPGWNTTSWTDGVQYVAFRNLVLSEGEALRIVSMPDAVPQAFINGLQIVKEGPAPVDTLINLSFGTDASPAKSGPAAFGLGPNDVWNRYSRDDGSGGYRTSGGLAPLLYSSGSPSTAGLAIENAPGAWGNGFVDAMFGVFLYPLGGGPVVTVTLTNLVEGTYSFYCYGHGDLDEQNVAFEILSSGFSLGTQETTKSARWKNPEFTRNDHYVLFENVPVYAGKPLVVLAKPSGISIGLINGLQVLKTSDVARGLVVIGPESSLFTNAVEVEIAASLPGDIRYTLDGSSPTESSSKYTGPLRLTAAATVNAALFSNGQQISDRVTKGFLRVYAIDDGISTEWRKRYFGEGYLTDPRVSADADPDHDGATNLQEYTVGSDPTDPLSGFLVSVGAVPQIRWHSVPGVKYRILTKKLLSDPGWTLVREIVATDIASRFTDEENLDPKAYYIVEIAPTAPSP